jgi:hypothetical protein
MNSTGNSTAEEDGGVGVSDEILGDILVIAAQVQGCQIFLGT